MIPFLWRYYESLQRIIQKKNGESRHMTFARLIDLPETFLETKVSGADSEQQYPEGMELVWDLKRTTLESLIGTQ